MEISFMPDYPLNEHIAMRELERAMSRKGVCIIERFIKVRRDWHTPYFTLACIFWSEHP